MNRRSDQRVQLNQSKSLTVMLDMKDDKDILTIRDISHGGMSFYCNQDASSSCFGVSDEIEAFICFNDTLIFPLVIRIVRKDADCIGVQFSAISLIPKMTLEQLFEGQRLRTADF